MTLTCPRSNVALSATGTLAPVFTDVPEGAFGENFINSLSYSGITSGCGGGNFCPDAPVTRGQMAVFIETALGHPANACTGLFADANGAAVGSAVCGFIERLAADGITGGCGSGTFCPNAPVTRGAMAVFMEAALGNPANACTGLFPDANAPAVGSAVCGFVERLAADGIQRRLRRREFLPQ